MTPEEILKEEFTLLKQELVDKYDVLGMRASGQFERELEDEYSSAGDNYTATIKGVFYSEQLEFGREPGGVIRGGNSFSDAIEQWIIDKGISGRIEGQISISSLAFLIVRKIMREGWDRKDYGGVELISQVVTPERIQGIIDRVGGALIEDFASTVIRTLKAA